MATKMFCPACKCVRFFDRRNEVIRMKAGRPVAAVPVNQCCWCFATYPAPPRKGPRPPAVQLGFKGVR